MKLGGLIEHELKRRGWSQERLGRHCGVDQSVVSRWISGKLFPGEDLIPILARWLPNVTAEEIRALKYSLVPPAVQISQLNQSVSRLLEQMTDFDARLKRLESPPEK